MIDFFLNHWKYSDDIFKYINIETGTEFDIKGFNICGIHKETGTKFDLDGYDKYGYDKHGYDKSGYDKRGYDKDGYNIKRFNRYGIHKETGTKFDLDGYDEYGYDKDKYNKEGFNLYGIHRETGTKFAPDGYNEYGFNKKGIHKETGTKFAPDGYNEQGFNKEGMYKTTGKRFNLDGYDMRGFNKRLIHKNTITEYDSEGFDWRGRDKDGYNRDGFDIEGYDRQGYDREGFNRKGIHRDTKTEYDPDGFNREGYDNEGYNREGLDKTGKNRNERQEIQTIQRKNYLGLINKAEKLASGQMTIEEYISKSKYSIEELIEFAKKQHLSPDVIRGLHKLKQQYKLYTTPFNKKQYLKITAIMIDGKLVKPTEQDVDICINYLRKKGTRICSFTVQDTIRQYLRGEIEIPQENMSNGVTNKTELEKLEEEQQRLTEQLKDIKRLEKQVTQAEGEKKTICIGE